MPKQYEAIRDKMMSQGMSEDEAQSHAAAIYNSKHKKNPVTGKKKHHKERHEEGSKASGSGIRELFK